MEFLLLVFSCSNNREGIEMREYSSIVDKYAYLIGCRNIIMRHLYIKREKKHKVESTQFPKPKKFQWKIMQEVYTQTSKEYLQLAQSQDYTS